MGTEKISLLHGYRTDNGHLVDFGVRRCRGSFPIQPNNHRDYRLHNNHNNITRTYFNLFVEPQFILSDELLISTHRIHPSDEFYLAFGQVEFHHFIVNLQVT